MKSKQLLIAIAAFAVTATGVQAYVGTDVLQKAGLTEEQISAFETARELKESGDFVAARDTLVEAGVDEETLRAVHEAAHAAREAVKAAIEANDYAAFKTAAAGTPLIEDVDTEDDFKRLVEAHNLKADGKWDEAKEILNELGIEQPLHMRGVGHGKHSMRGQKHHFDDLSYEQRQALEVAHKANDKEAVKAILKEAGIEPRTNRGMHW